MRYVALMMLLAGPLAAQDAYEFTNVSNLEVRNGVRVELTQGPEITVTAEAISGDVSQVEFRQFGEWLVVSRNQRWLIFPYGRQDEIVVKVTLPNVRNLKARDGGVLDAQGFAPERFRGEALEGGTVTLSDMDFARVTLFATDGGVLTADGTCAALTVEASQRGSVTADGLLCDTAKTRARSNGQVAANAASFATLRESSGGVVTLTGAAEIVEEIPETPEG